MTIEVRRATADEIRPLRLGVLRPDAPLEPAGYDLDPAAVHVGAFDDGWAVGCASVFPDPYDAVVDAWRLRGMAVDAAYQGHNIGRRVLELATNLAEEQGAPLLWANARTTALGFYEAMGWRAVGEEFTYGPAELPHFVIVRGGNAVGREILDLPS